MLRQVMIFLCFGLMLPGMLNAYAYLSEYISEDGQVLRSPGSSGQGSDMLKHPRWPNAAIDIVLCTGGDAIQNADVREPGDFTEWTDELLTATNAAIAAWTNARDGTSLNVNLATKSSDCGPDEGSAYGGKEDGQNRLFFNNRFEDGTPIPGGVIAFTVLSLEADDGDLKIVDADIIFNTSGEFDFQGVLTHELGHFFGIAHSLVNDDNSSDAQNTSVTMFPSISGLGASLAELMLDDKLGIQALYPDDTTGGSLSGFVFRADGQPQRGAQITAFAVEDAVTLAASFSSMSKTRAGADGSYSIQGLPLNKDFIVFVEPAHRPTEVHSNFRYDVINTPIQQALLFQIEGYRQFAVEAYPDVEIVDIRVTRDITQSPRIDAAQVFRFTSDKKSIKNVNFYLSQDFLPPNDALNTELNINPQSDENLLINNQNPLQLYIELPTDLSIFENPELSLSAKVGGNTLNWSDTIPEFEWRSKSALITIALPSPAPRDGNYEFTFRLEDSKYGDFVVTRTGSIVNWTRSSAGVVLGEETSANEAGNSGGGGGGCSLQITNFTPVSLVWIFVLFLSLWWLRRSRLLLEPKSYPDQKLHEELERPS